MTAHLAALVIVVPLLAGPLAMLARHRTAAWLVAFVTSVTALVMAAMLATAVAAGGPIHYALGGFAPPIGIELRIDAAATLMLVVVTGISTAVLAYARASVEQEVPADRIHLFYAAWLLCLAGLLGICATGDAFNLFVFMEISSLASYALVAAGRDRRALTAAFQYLIMGTVGATFYLIGVAALYSATGTLNMADLAVRLADVGHLRIIHVGFAFMLVGLSLKLALFPLHLWLPGAYTHAPSAVSAFLAGTATKVALYALLRALYDIFGTHFSFTVMSAGALLTTLAVLAVMVASFVAIFQNNVKRLLAYSSVAQIGYMVLGASYGTAGGLGAGLLHLFNHALIKTALFLAIGAAVFRGLTPTLDGLRGFARHMPWTAAAAVVGGLSLIGVPLTAGFTGKWMLVSAAAVAGDWAIVAAIVGSSLLTVAYVWRLVEAAYFAGPNPDSAGVREAPATLLVPLWVLAAANIYFGIDTTISFGLARDAAAALLGGLN